MKSSLVIILALIFFGIILVFGNYLVPGAGDPKISKVQGALAGSNLAFSDRNGISTPDPADEGDQDDQDSEDEIVPTPGVTPTVEATEDDEDDWNDDEPE